MFEVFKYATEITGWLLGGGIIAAAAVVVGLYLPQIRNVCVAVVVVALSNDFFLAKGVYLAHQLDAAKQQAENQHLQQIGTKARADAERSVDSSTAGRVRDGTDSFDRDVPAGDVHPVAKHHLLFQKRLPANSQTGPRPQ